MHQLYSLLVKDSQLLDYIYSDLFFSISLMAYVTSLNYFTDVDESLVT